MFKKIREYIVVGFLFLIGIDKIIARLVLSDPFVKEQLKDVDKTMEKIKKSADLAREIVEKEKLENLL